MTFFVKKNRQIQREIYSALPEFKQTLTNFSPTYIYMFFGKSLSKTCWDILILTIILYLDLFLFNPRSAGTVLRLSTGSLLAPVNWAFLCPLPFFLEDLWGERDDFFLVDTRRSRRSRSPPFPTFPDLDVAAIYDCLDLQGDDLRFLGRGLPDDLLLRFLLCTGEFCWRLSEEVDLFEVPSFNPVSKLHIFVETWWPTFSNGIVLL